MNTHLMTTVREVSNFLKTHNQPPEDLIESFIDELHVSNLMIAAIPQNDGITFEHLESEEGIMILPLFSSKDKYDGENELIANPISYYAGIVMELDFSGIVINPDHEGFFVPGEAMSAFLDDDKTSEGGLSGEELKSLSPNIRNDELVSFISDDDNFNRFDELIKKLEGAVLLNVVSSSKDLSEYAHDGIISAIEAGGFALSVKSQGREKYGLIFTSLDKITDTCDVNSGIFYYYQISSLNKLFEYVLMHDLDGIIINPDIEEYFIPRNVLLDIYLNHNNVIDHPKYRRGMNYAFLIE